VSHGCDLHPLLPVLEGVAKCSLAKDETGHGLDEGLGRVRGEEEDLKQPRKQLLK
jgi:hypothetical protein